MKVKCNILILTLILSFIIGNFWGTAHPPEAIAATSWFTDGDGFESPWNPTDNVGNWGSFALTPVKELTIIKKGSVSMNCSVGSTFMQKNTGSNQTEFWADFWVYPDATIVNTDVANFADATGGNLYLRVQSDNTVHLIKASLDLNMGTASDDTWTHMFIHIIYNDPNSTVQYRSETGDYRTGWDYDNAAVNIGRSLCRILSFGIILGSGAVDNYYFDALRSWYGATEPTEWVTPSGSQIIMVN